MNEKVQYGQRLSLQTENVIKSMYTGKSYVEYAQTTDHGCVLTIDGEIQLATSDEYRYHEMLVHPVMKKVTDNGAGMYNLSVLILGGGDGCAAREVYKWGNVKDVTIVDYDPLFVTEFGKKWFRGVNKDVFSRNNLVYENFDAARFVEIIARQFDVIIIDLPDPSDPKMIAVYEQILTGSNRILKHGGGIGMHVGPALLNEYNVQWKTISKFKDMLLHTFNSRKPDVKFYTTYVPSFSNEWGFLQLSADKYPDRKEDVYTNRVSKMCRFWAPNKDVTPKDIEEIYKRRF